MNPVDPLYATNEKTAFSFIRCNTCEFKKFIQENPVNIDACDENGKTFLHYAAQYTSLPTQYGLIESILRKKPNPFIADRDGKTPLMVLEGNENVNILENYEKEYIETRRTTYQAEIFKHIAQTLALTAEMIPTQTPKQAQQIQFHCDAITRTANYLKQEYPRTRL